MHVKGQISSLEQMLIMYEDLLKITRTAWTGTPDLQHCTKMAISTIGMTATLEIIGASF